jgi:CheY-like chemotaxis protein
MDGMTSTRAIRQHEDLHHITRCRIIALTGLASPNARLEALSSGVDHFITKPISFRLLGSLLEKEDERRKHINEAKALMINTQEEDMQPTTCNRQLEAEKIRPQTEASDGVTELETDELLPKHSVLKTDLQQENARAVLQEDATNIDIQEDAKKVGSQSQLARNETQQVIREGEAQQVTKGTEAHEGNEEEDAQHETTRASSQQETEREEGR